MSVLLSISSTIVEDIKSLISQPEESRKIFIIEYINKDVIYEGHPLVAYASMHRTLKEAYENFDKACKQLNEGGGRIRLGLSLGYGEDYEYANLLQLWAFEEDDGNLLEEHPKENT